MNPGEWKVLEEYQISSDDFVLRIAVKRPDGGMDVMLPAQFATYAYGQGAPTASWMTGHALGGSTRGLLQAFLDLAWDKGMRPKGYENTSNQLRAVGAHLCDMRAIVATKLNVKLP